MRKIGICMNGPAWRVRARGRQTPAANMAEERLTRRPRISRPAMSTPEPWMACPPMNAAIVTRRP